MNDTLLGFIYVGLAIFFFSIWALPLRVKIIADLNIHCIIFQLYFSTAVFCFSWVALFLSPFAFTYLGFVGAAIWVPLSICGILAIYNLGLAVPTAVGNGMTIVISFLWGTLGFHEQIKSVGFAILALVLLLVGIVGLCMCNAHIRVNLPPVLSFLYILPFLQDPAADEELLEFSSPSKFKYSESPSPLHKIVPKDDHRGELTHLNWVIGLGCAIIVGLLNGSVMVPTHFVPSTINTIQYFMSFSIGLLVITILVAAVYFGALAIRKRPLPELHWRLGVPAACICGSLWVCGFFFSIFATRNLGFSLGYPLAQTSLLLTGVWGMVLFKEITEVPRIVTFFVSAVIMLSGAFVLSMDR